MSNLRLDTWEMPAADLGCKNPLPQLGKPVGPHGEEKSVGPDAIAEVQRRLDETMPGERLDAALAAGAAAADRASGGVTSACQAERRYLRCAHK